MESESHCCPGIQIVEHVLQPQLFPFPKINAKGENLYFCLISKKKKCIFFLFLGGGVKNVACEQVLLFG